MCAMEAWQTLETLGGKMMKRIGFHLSIYIFEITLQGNITLHGYSNILTFEIESFLLFEAKFSRIVVQLESRPSLLWTKAFC